MKDDPFLAANFRVVVIYDDFRAGIWRGPWEDREAAWHRRRKEQGRVHGRVEIEERGP